MGLPHVDASYKVKDVIESPIEITVAGFAKIQPIPGQYAGSPNCCESGYWSAKELRMSLLLCHQCLSWTEPRNSRCTICAERVDLASRDPSFEELARKIGVIEYVLGTVSFPRKLLPDLGTVYATTHGLFFLPHRQVQEQKLVEGNSTGSSIFWIMAGLAFAPISFLSPLLRKKTVERKIVPVLHPLRLRHDESDRLPLLLMNHPGVVFISIETVGSIKKKGSWWLIERKFGSVLRFRTHKGDKSFHHEMQQLLNIDPWSQFHS